MSDLLGLLSKMKTNRTHDGHVQYELEIDEESIFFHECLETEIGMRFSGRIFCQSCGKQTKKSFSQGYCYPCFLSLAQTDMCMVRPETCHFAQGTCRNPDWGQKHCFIPHTVYLANSSGVKVGVTRSHQQQTRWMDQGAIQALPILSVDSRKKAGEAEVFLKQYFNDKTSWQKMLKGKIDHVDLKKQMEEIKESVPLGDGIKKIEEDEISFIYPVVEYPIKVKSFNFDKDPNVYGTLLGIKGQYLIFDTGVINIRKYSGYEIELEGL